MNTQLKIILEVNCGFEVRYFAVKLSEKMKKSKGEFTIENLENTEFFTFKVVPNSKIGIWKEKSSEECVVIRVKEAVLCYSI